MNEDDIKKLVFKTMQEYNKSRAFMDRKNTDTPTDSFSLVNRKFVTANGLVASRPVSSVATVGQPYFATDTKIPMVYDTTGWVDGVGSIVAQNS